MSTSFVPFNPDALDWDRLLGLSQKGSGDVNPFRGWIRQRGTGFGQLLLGALKLIPLFLSSPVGQQLTETGSNVLKDISSGENLTQSVKRNARQAVRNLTGVGPKKRNKRILGKLTPHSQISRRTKRSYLLSNV